MNVKRITMDINFLVRVSCMTYNQASYIKDAMNGFCMQETSFPYVCTIIDDASTDGEQEIINRYLQAHFNLQDKTIVRNEETDDYVLTFARHKTNINCYFAVFFLKYNHYRKKSKAPYIQEWANTKYLAICEGDDFWINPHKLQMQFEMLENHQKYSMCCHNAIILNTNDNSIKAFNVGISKGVMSAHTVIDRWSIPTASMFVRAENYDYPDWLVKIYSGDMALYLRCMNAGDIYYFDEFMSIYRYNTDGNSESSKMKGKEIYILEQHNLLLDSFNKGTDGKFDKEISEKIKKNKQYISYISKKQKGLLFCVFEPFFYYRLLSKIKGLFVR